MTTDLGVTGSSPVGRASQTPRQMPVSHDIHHITKRLL